MQRELKTLEESAPVVPAQPAVEPQEKAKQLPAPNAKSDEAKAQDEIKPAEEKEQKAEALPKPEEVKEESTFTSQDASSKSSSPSGGTSD